MTGVGNEPGLRTIRVRYEGACVVCGTVLPAGATARWHRPTKTLRCVECPSPEPSTPEAAPVDVGVAGASAQREYDRRQAKRESAVRERFGRRLGTLIVAATPVPQSTLAWRQGARGETALAKGLADVPGIRVLHDRRVPRTRGNIDHLVVAPAGVFVIDAKHLTGRIEIRDVGPFFRREPRLYVGGRDRSYLAEGMGWQVDAVRGVLDSVARSELAVHPVLCFVDGDWPLLFPPDSFAGVRLESPRSLRRLILDGSALKAEEIDTVAGTLAAAFPPK